MQHCTKRELWPVKGDRRETVGTQSEVANTVGDDVSPHHSSKETELGEWLAFGRCGGQSSEDWLQHRLQHWLTTSRTHTHLLLLAMVEAQFSASIRRPRPKESCGQSWYCPGREIYMQKGETASAAGIARSIYESEGIMENRVALSVIWICMEYT
jgi:hypothetical protein